MDTRYRVTGTLESIIAAGILAFAIGAIIYYREPPEQYKPEQTAPVKSNTSYISSMSQ